MGNDTTKLIEMEHGKFNKDSLINAIPHKPVIPVFLNTDKQPQWIPLSLVCGASYTANIKALQEGCLGIQDQLEWISRVQHLLSNDRRLEDLVDLRKVLLRDTPTNTPTVPPIIIEDNARQKFLEQLFELAEDVSFFWQNLATKLGVSFNAQRRIERCGSDCTQRTRLMFEEWTETKRELANKQALIQALKECKYYAIADRVDRTFS